MDLIPANDFDTVKAKYIDVIKNTPGIEQYARWVYGKHPTDTSLRTYIDNGEMYFLMDDGAVAGMVAIVMHQGQEYAHVLWAENLAFDQVAALHLLAVCPNYRGRSLGVTLLEKAAELAGKNGKKALRLDTLESNLPAQRMYDRAGFSYRGKNTYMQKIQGGVNSGP